jgi:2,4-dienoyl-CoA reductase (NADPH2)
VEIHLGREVEAADIETLAPDAVMVATGGRLVAPKITGDHLSHVFTGRELRRLLGGTLGRAKVAINTVVRIQRIERHSVVLLLESGGEHHVRADNVILASSVEPDTNLVESLRDRVPEIYAVGDCTGPGLIKKATLDGAQAAAAL